MDINHFDSYASAGKCPVCGGSNLSSFKNSNGMTIYECRSCGGVPSYCKGTVYIHRGSMSDFNDGNCGYCGERRASANDHAFLCKW